MSQDQKEVRASHKDIWGKGLPNRILDNFKGGVDKFPDESDMDMEKPEELRKTSGFLPEQL